MSESAAKKRKVDVPLVDNFINGTSVAPTTGKYIDVTTPHDGSLCGRVAVSAAADVEAAVKAGKEAFQKWGSITVKTRAQYMLKLHALMRDRASEIAEIIVKEHGKTMPEALAEVAKGNETCEYACSMPQLIGGKVLEVSRGVECREYKKPLGVVASIVPFNFPCMVPFWTVPIALATGNCVIVKPSEKVPLTMAFVMSLFKEAGFPDGVIQIINGTVDAVNAICDHPDIKAVSFVGSTKIAELVSKRCRGNNKRCIALGGAKNHLVAVPDCNLEMTATDVVNSYTGCTGQRCMAASILLTIGPQPELINRIVEQSKTLVPGSGSRNVGPLIDQASLDRINSYLDNPEHELLLDGREWVKQHGKTEGFWLGPTIIKHKNPKDPAMLDELFGPVISIYECKNKEEAVAIENSNPYGNAACVYTSTGAAAEYFIKNFSVGMVGVNIGVPVPREPFSFGGYNTSKFGDCDITGDGGIEFFTYRLKVTQKWNPPKEQDWMS